MPLVNRRTFLGTTTAAAALSLGPGRAIGQMIGAYAPFTDYRALVCVFLYGGNDSFNMLVPRSHAEHAVYARARQNLAVPRDALLPISPLDGDGIEYGVHPTMPGLQKLFELGRLAFVANVGPLIEPTTKEQLLNNSVRVPPRLFSHNDQQAQWQSLRGESLQASGWGGRIGDILRDAVTQQRLPIGVSLNGNALFLSGDVSPTYTMGQNGPVAFRGIQGRRRDALQRILNLRYPSTYSRALANVQRRALDTYDRVQAALQHAPPLTTPFPESALGRQLSTIARLISVRDHLQLQRQIFFVALGGFDTHDQQEMIQPRLFENLSSALAAFYDATVELGVSASVTTFTQSEFGRTLTSNGDGTDHGWGGTQLVLGDAVLGRRIYGQYPRLELGGPEDVGGGRMIPGVATDQFAATLARWFGISESDLLYVAPHLTNFGETELRFLA